MSHEGITAYPDRIEEVIKISIAAMKNKEGLFAHFDPQPERKFIDLAKRKGPEFALNAVFLATTMVLGGQTARLFRRMSDPNLFEENAWLFEPSEVARKRSDTVTRALFNYIHPAGRESASIFQWQYNCRIIRKKYGGFVSNYFKDRENDTLMVYKDLVVRPRAKTHEKEIRRFGPKITKLFIQWVREYNLYPLKNTESVGLPVDFQVARVTIQTGGLTLENPVGAHFITHDLLPEIFDEMVKRGYKPEDISKALWAIGSGGCAPRAHNLCPVKDFCTSLISSRRYDNDGVFDPRDVGRYSGPKA